MRPKWTSKNSTSIRACSLNRATAIFLENYNLGVAWQATPQVELALDYQRINYADVASVGNPSGDILNCTLMGGTNAANCLGGSAGAGFGYSNIDVWKLGMEYKASQNMTYRAGYSHNDNPISGSDTLETGTFNIIAPGGDHGSHYLGLHLHAGIGR